MKKIFLGVYNPSIILTFIGVFCSLCGIGTLMMDNYNNSVNAISIAMILLVIAGICDMFDGRIARLCKRTEKEKEFGIQLDSLADTVSFVIFPAVILLSMQMNIANVIIAMFYIFAGIMRLGWFNVTAEENKGFYMGLPVTFSALIFPILYLILQFVILNFENIIFQIAYAITAFAFITNFKMKKPGLIFSIVMILVAIGVIAGILLV